LIKYQITFDVKLYKNIYLLSIIPLPKLNKKRNSKIKTTGSLTIYYRPMSATAEIK